MKRLKNSILRCLAAAVFSVLLSVGVHAEQRITVDYQVYTMDNNQQTGWVKGYDESGNQLWYYQCGMYPRTELNSVTILGIGYGRVYLVEGGTLVALDLASGYIDWMNSDFGGVPSSKGFQVSTSGKVYLCGYYGPDFFVADSDGKTISRINSLSGSYWPYNMRFTTDDNMKIDYESDGSSIEFNVTNYFGTIQY